MNNWVLINTYWPAKIRCLPSFIGSGRNPDMNAVKGSHGGHEESGCPEDCSGPSGGVFATLVLSFVSK